MSYLPHNLEDIPDHRLSYELSLPPVRTRTGRKFYALYWKMDDHTGKCVYRVISTRSGTTYGYVYWYADKEPVLKLARLMIDAIYGTARHDLLKEFMGVGGYSVIPIRPDLIGGDATWFDPDWDYDDD